MLSGAIKFGELYEFIEGTSRGDAQCDGCNADIKHGAQCFASVLLPDREHPNYQKQNPEVWASGFIDIKK